MDKIEMPVYDAVQDKNIPYILVVSDHGCWIENNKGVVVSPKIRQFKVLSVLEVNGTHTRYLLGTEGNLWRFYKPPTHNTKKFKAIGDSFHCVSYHTELGGIFLAQTGASIKILNSSCLTTHRSGYHSYFMDGGHLFASLGSSKFKISSAPKHVVLDCYLTREYKSL